MKRLSNKVMLMLAAMQLAVFTISCSKSSDEPEPGGGGIISDPVTPSEIKYELNANAVLIPKEVCQNLVSVDTLGHRLVLPKSAGKPKVGQCLIFSTPTNQLPYGLLAMVKDVKETGSGYEIIYEDAELGDAFKTIDMPEQTISLGEHVEHVYDAQGREVQFSRIAETRDGGIKKYTISLPEIGWEIIKGIQLTPKMSINMVMRYGFQFGNGELSYANVKLDAEVTVGADLTCELSATNIPDKKLHLFTIVCAPIPIGPVVLTPSLNVNGVLGVDGKIALEASISYTRTVHSTARYTIKDGLDGNCYADDEAPDALKFSFGPKFEGGIHYGLILAGNLGVYHKTLAVRAELKVLKKESISGKLDYMAFTGSSQDWLIGYTPSAAPAPMYAKHIIESASKWSFFKYEDLMYNQSLGVTIGWYLTTLGLDVTHIELPEMGLPISSVPINPQVKIEEKDFFESKYGATTLTLHHPGKSLLDEFVSYRAVFTPKGSSGGKIETSFNFDDNIRNILQADEKGYDVTTNAEASLKEGQDYRLIVYMNVLKVDIPIFVGDVKAKKDASVNPEKLEFEAKGGTKQVKIDKGSYQYCGADVAPDDNSWLEATVSDDGTVSVTAKANTEGEERQATLNCWVSDKASPSDAEKTLLPVSIKQAPKVTLELVSSYIFIHCVTWQIRCDFKAGDDNLTITPVGDGLRVSYSKEGADYAATWKYTLSFVVDDLSLVDSKQASITDFRYDYEKNGGEYDYYGNHVAWTHEITRLSSNAPVVMDQSGFWHIKDDNLDYYNNQTVHYDKFKEDYYGPYIEKTFVNEISEAPKGSNVSIGPNFKKK